MIGERKKEVRGSWRWVRVEAPAAVRSTRLRSRSCRMALICTDGLDISVQEPSISPRTPKTKGDLFESPLITLSSSGVKAAWQEKLQLTS